MRTLSACVLGSTSGPAASGKQRLCGVTGVRLACALVRGHAGMEEGGVCAWDLEEPASRHPQDKVGGQVWALRRPAFTSEAEVDPAAAAPVRDIACVARQQAAAGGGGGGERGGAATVVALGAFGEVRRRSLHRARSLVRCLPLHTDDDERRWAGRRETSVWRDRL